MYEYLRGLLTKSYEVTADINPDSSLSSLGLDSFSRVELGAILQDTFKITVANEDVSASTTVRQLARILEGKGAAAS